MDTLAINVYWDHIANDTPLDTLYIDLMTLGITPERLSNFATITVPCSDTSDEFAILNDIFDNYSDCKQHNTVFKSAIRLISFANKHNIKLINTEKCLSVADTMLEHNQLSESDRKLIMDYIMQITDNIDLKSVEYRTFALDDTGMMESHDAATNFAFIDVDRDETSLATIRQIDNNRIPTLSLDFNPEDVITKDQFLKLAKRYQKNPYTIFAYDGRKYQFH